MLSSIGCTLSGAGFRSRVSSKGGGLPRLFLGLPVKAISSINLPLHFVGSLGQSILTVSQGFSSQAISPANLKPHETSQEGIYNNSHEGQPADKKLFFIVGFSLFVFGLLLSKKVFWELDSYFAAHSSIAIPFAVLGLSAILMWLGMGFAAYGIGWIT